MDLENLPSDILKIIMEYKQNLEDRIAHAERTFVLNREFRSIYYPDIAQCLEWYGENDQIGLD